MQVPLLRAVRFFLILIPVLRVESAVGLPPRAPGAAEGERRGAPSTITTRGSSEIEWIRVHPPGDSPCPPVSVEGSAPGQTVEHVWCFEGAGGLSR